MPEVMKTRLQLQGELQRADSSAPRVYKNVFDVFAKTWKMEGFRGLQRGLIPAVSSLRVLHPPLQILPLPDQNTSTFTLYHKPIRIVSHFYCLLNLIRTATLLGAAYTAYLHIILWILADDT
jgi:hypothetical protein